MLGGGKLFLIETLAEGDHLVEAGGGVTLVVGGDFAEVLDGLRVLSVELEAAGVFVGEFYAAEGRVDGDGEETLVELDGVGLIGGGGGGPEAGDDGHRVIEGDLLILRAGGAEFQVIEHAVAA